MTTVQAMAEKVRRRLRATSALGELTVLTEALDASETGIDVAADLGDNEIAALAVGAIIECDAERMIVTSFESTNTLNVIRGVDGTTAATHSSGAVVWVEPVVGLAEIIDAMRDEIRSWPTTLFQEASTTLSFGSKISTVDLGISAGVDVYRILAAQRTHTDGAAYGYRTPALELLRNMDTGTWASGFAVQLLDPAWTYSETVSIRLTYAKAFDTSTFDLTTDLTTTVGLATSMEDLLAWGAGVRVLTGILTNRASLEAQGMSRHSEEVTSEDITTALESWLRMREMRLAEETRRLQARYPIVMQ